MLLRGVSTMSKLDGRGEGEVRVEGGRGGEGKPHTSQGLNTGAWMGCFRN